jgi:hypothetical protein
VGKGEADNLSSFSGANDEGGAVVAGLLVLLTLGEGQEDGYVAVLV